MISETHLNWSSTFFFAASLMTLHLKVFFFIFFLFSIEGSRAPDLSPDLPSGWCNLKYGTPTKSTGECICKEKCQGSGCHFEHGLHWYQYKACPTCQCISKNIETTSITKPPPDSSSSTPPSTSSSSSSNPSKTPINKVQEVKQTNQQTIEQSNDNQEDHQEEEQQQTFLDILEENSRLIFAGIITLIVFSLVISALFIPSPK